MRRLAGASAAGDLRWISGYLSIKEPRSPCLWWHQDWWCWDHPISYRKAPVQIAVLCYLTDTAPDNGALRIVEGSHLNSFPIHAILPEAHGEAASGLAPGHPAMSDLREQTTIRVRAGDAVILDYRLLHGTHANNSDFRRDCILLVLHTLVAFIAGSDQVPPDLSPCASGGWGGAVRRSP